MVEKTLESPLDCKEIKPVNPKGNQSWIFIGRTDTEAEAPILWPSDVKKWFTGKDSDSGTDSWQEEKGTTQDEMVGWYHWINRHEFEQALGDGEGQWNLACCNLWGGIELDVTEWLNNSKKNKVTLWPVYVKDGSVNLWEKKSIVEVAQNLKFLNWGWQTILRTYSWTQQEWTERLHRARESLKEESDAFFIAVERWEAGNYIGP